MSGIHKMKKGAGVLGILTALLFLWSTGALAVIDGITGPSFSLEAKADYITTSDGDSILMWGYAVPGSRMQYPGPTLIVNQGDNVTVTLANRLSEPVSIVFPGQKVTAAGGSAGLFTQESTAPGDFVTYTFTATNPGTYLYRSGTHADLQVEMGLVGALIVRPSRGSNYAYNADDTGFDHEYLYLITEMDPVIHRKVELGQPVDTTKFFATNWFINGRNFPDNMAESNVPWLPTQPYNCQPRMHPGETVLVRLIGAGVDLHPMHLHGNDFDTIAVDGRVLSSAPDMGANLRWKATTIRTVPGQTADVLWTWTGENMGWDIYGHVPGDGTTCVDGDGDQLDDVTKEFCPDHQVPFPVTLPTRDSVTFGPLYSGSPFLGGAGELPPGEGGMNQYGGFFYMWHSHTEKELTSNDIWPGGLVSFMIVEPHGVPIP